MIPSNGPTWIHQMAGADSSITGTWPTVVAALVMVGFLALAYQRAPGEDAPDLPAKRRVGLGLLVVAALLLMSAGFVIFCSAPDSFFYFFFGARFVIALIPLALLAAYPPSRWGTWNLRVPFRLRSRWCRSTRSSSPWPRTPCTEKSRGRGEQPVDEDTEARHDRRDLAVRAPPQLEHLGRRFTR